MHIDPAGDRAMVRKTRRPRESRPWQRMINALLALAHGQAQLLRHAETSWASVTFSGTRHTLTLLFEGAEAMAAGEALIAALPDHEFTIPRQIVADAAVTGCEHSLLPEARMEVEVELLLLEDC